MNKYVRDYFKEERGDTDHGRFYKVITVNRDMPWAVVQQESKMTPRGWFELVHIDIESRIEFVEQFWNLQLAEHPLVESFFEKVEDIVLFLIQQKEGEPFNPHLVYSLKDDAGFYQGTPPFSDVIIEEHSFFHGEPLPADYLAFQRIHGQFGKNGDSGIYNIKQLLDGWKFLQEFLKKSDRILFYGGEPIDRKKLIPFYNSHERYSWQCFCADCLMEEEMGNTLIDHETISLLMHNNEGFKCLVFPSFLNWFEFYLQSPLEV